MPFVAAYHLNYVGFGVLDVSQEYITYEHFGVKLDKSIFSADKFKIQLSPKSNR